MFLLWEWGLHVRPTRQPGRGRAGGYFAAQMGSPRCVKRIYVEGIPFPYDFPRVSQPKSEDLRELQLILLQGSGIFKLRGDQEAG